jgi:hypothetical protein
MSIMSITNPYTHNNTTTSITNSNTNPISNTR